MDQGEAAKDGHRAWADLQAGFAGERDGLDKRKQSRTRWGIKGIFDGLFESEPLCGLPTTYMMI